MNEIERKVDMLISGMKLPKKKTRSRVATIATTLLIAIALIAGASLIEWVQTGTVNVTSDRPVITINDKIGWEEIVIIDISAGGTKIIPDPNTTPPYYTIEYVAGSGGDPITVYFHIDITEDDTPIDNDIENGLRIEIWGWDYGDLLEPSKPPVLMPLMTDGYGQIEKLAPGDSVDFEIHITANEYINAASTYKYTITTDLKES